MDFIKIWKDIPGYEGLYKVSDTGDILSVRTGKLRRLKLTKFGYNEVNIQGRVFKVHRLVLLAFVGISHLDCDHINGLKTDNRIVNLRYCSRREDVSNHYMKSPKSSMFTGVTLNKTSGKWQAAIKRKNKSIALGIFDSQELAHKAYQSAKSKMPEVGLARLK